MVVRGEQLVEVDFSRGLCSIVFHKAAIGELRTGRLTAIRAPGVLASKYRCSHYRWNTDRKTFVRRERPSFVDEIFPFSFNLDGHRYHGVSGRPQSSSWSFAILAQALAIG